MTIPALQRSLEEDQPWQTDILGYLGHNWGWIVLRGVAAVLFGVLAIAWPGITLAALVIVWGACALADGVLALIAAWQVRDQGRPFWSLVVVGLVKSLPAPSR